MARAKKLPGEDFKEIGLWHFNDFWRCHSYISETFGMKYNVFLKSAIIILSIFRTVLWPW